MKKLLLRLAALSAAFLLPYTSALADDYAVTFGNGDNGSITVTDINGQAITSGSTVAAGSEIVITAKPTTYAYTASIDVNGTTLTAKAQALDSYFYVYTVSAATTITPTFSRKNYDYYNYTTDKGRNIYSIIFSQNNEEKGTITIPHETSATASRSIWQDMTAQTVKVNANEEITINTTGTGQDLGSYFFVDLDHDGTFTPNVLMDNLTAPLGEGNECLTFNLYKMVTGSNVCYNSLGVNVNRSGSEYIAGATTSDKGPGIPLPTITLSNTGKYYARFNIDWNTVSPTGTENYGNGPEQIDFIVEVTDPNATGAVTVAETVGGSVVVKNVTDGSTVTSGTTVDKEKLLLIELNERTHGYAFNGVKVNGVALTADEEGKYYYATNGDDLTIEGVFVDKSTFKPTVNFSATGGDITVTDSNGKTLNSGDTVDYDSDITVTSSYAYNCDLTVNSKTVEGKDGVFTISATEDLTISATLTQKYTCATGTTNGTYKSDDTANNRYISSVSLYVNNGDEQKIETGITSYQHELWIDKTSEIVSVKAGDTVMIRYAGLNGHGGEGYLYIDYNKNGSFDKETSLTYYQNKVSTIGCTNELVSFNAYRLGKATNSSDSNYYNYNGEAITAYTPSTWDYDVSSTQMSDFVIPELESGIYYARFVSDWNNLNTDGTGGIIGRNGTIVDFLFEVVEASAEPVKVTINEPSTEQGTMTVVKADSGDEVATGDTLTSGTQLKITVTPTDEYLLDSVTATLADGNAGTVKADADDASVFYYTMSGNDVTIAAQFTKKSDKKFSVTITTPSNGSLELQQNGATVSSVLYGSEVTVVPVPADGYYCTAVTANGNALTANEDGSYTYQVLEETTFAATFAQKWALNSAITSSTQTNGGTDGNNNRWITKITLEGKNLAEKTVETGATTYTHNAYVDKSSEVVKVKAGETITLSQVANEAGVGMCSFLYIDYDNSYTFDYEKTYDYYVNHGTATLNKTNELVTFNAYRWSDGKFFNSDGVEVTSKNPGGWNLSTTASEAFAEFTIPENLPVGKYRARFVCDWNNMSTSYIDPGRNGVILDFTIEVVENNYNVVVSTPEKQSKLGSVCIEGVDGTTTTTDQAVTVVATPAKDVTNDNGKVRNVKFMCWTDAEGKILSDEATYTYSSYDAANLVAHFGYQVNVLEVNNGGGTVTISKKSANAQSAPAYISDLDSTVTTYANDTDNQVSIVAASTFANVDDAAVSNGQGTVLEAGEEYVISAKSSDDAHTITTVYVRNETSQENEVAENYSEGSDTNISKTTEYTKTITLDDPYNVAVTFWAVNTGVEDIAADSIDAAAEYYNINGTRVDGGNLTPGLYIMRQGNKVNKILVK